MIAADPSVVDDPDLDRLIAMLARYAGQAPARDDEDGVPWRYKSPFEMVLDLGTPYPPGFTVQIGKTLGDDRSGVDPFRKVWRYALENNMVYVEGYALWAGDPLPRRHAWLSPLREVPAVELHRSDLADAYVGVGFDPEAFVRDGEIRADGALNLWVCRTGLNRLTQHRL